MKYLLMIYGDEVAQEQASPEAGAQMMEAYDKFGHEMGERGVLRGGERLRPTSDATTVRVRDGKLATADGPYAETKEQIGGYFVVDCKDLDEAVAIAAAIPGAHFGAIEVRPIWDM